MKIIGEIYATFNTWLELASLRTRVALLSLAGNVDLGSLEGIASFAADVVAKNIPCTDVQTSVPGLKLTHWSNDTRFDLTIIAGAGKAELSASGPAEDMVVPMSRLFVGEHRLNLNRTIVATQIAGVLGVEKSTIETLTSDIDVARLEYWGRFHAAPGQLEITRRLGRLTQEPVAVRALPATKTVETKPAVVETVEDVLDRAMAGCPRNMLSRSREERAFIVVRVLARVVNKSSLDAAGKAEVERLLRAEAKLEVGATGILTGAESRPH